MAQVTVKGSVYGGGNQADVMINTTVNMSTGTVEGNVYGGGNLGDVGTIDKTDEKDGQLTYNYAWTQTDGSNANTAHNNKITGTNTNTGVCTVIISGGTIGTAGDQNTDPTKVETGNVFGGGKGNRNAKFYCEEGMVFATSVAISGGTTVHGCVYGGGEIGRVEDDTKVTISVTSNDGIKGNVFGAGKGLKTHGYSALVRGNTEVTVEGNSKIGHSVYGGGETASLGRFVVVGGSPATPDGGGGCTVVVRGSAEIGTSGAGDVFGAGMGLIPETYTYADKANMPYRMMAKSMGSFTDANSAYWDEVDANNVKEYFPTRTIYLDFLRTLALASTPTVTIGGTAIIHGSVFGGGQRGITLGEVNVSMTGGTVNESVYGGGAFADTNTGNWSLNNYEPAGTALNDDETITDLFTRENTGTENEPKYKYSRIYNTSTPLSSAYRRVPIWADATDKSAVYKTNVSLTGGKIAGDAFGGGLGQIASSTLENIEALVYGDVKVELNKDKTTDDKGCVVSRIFGCNDMNGTPKGHVKVYVYATQKDGTQKIGSKTSHTGLEEEGATTTYDVKAVYGGGNLAPYIPVDALLDYNVAANKDAVEAARTEVYIYGCDLTSIKQVYAGGNAASVSGSYVVVNSVYEIEEVFGGGNGADEYSLNSETYENPGANVGYYNYTHFVKNNTTGKYEPVDNTDPDASTKEARQANYRYGSGIARTEIRGGKIHVVYGGSNKKGNISTTAVSVYESTGDCPMSIDQTYGGGKDAPIDGEVQVELACATGIEEIFGGAMNADIDADVNLRITNGSSLKNVFGGNNTSGAINGSITVTIEEGGCEPIHIDNLYLGGYLAPYSVYGYQKTGDTYDTESVAYIDKNGETQHQVQRIPLTSGSNPKQDPRINVISASYIGNIFGGGYQAKLVGNPHVNVNMKEGKVSVTNTGTEQAPVYKDAAGNEYAQTQVNTSAGIATLPIGTIGNVYGGGYLADVVGDPYVEIGTGRWVKEWDANGPVYESEDESGNKYTYKIKTPAVKYTEQECTSTNASLPGAISTSTELTDAQATRLNELLNISTYSEGISPSSEHVEAYNATLDGYITTVDIKTPAVWAWYNASNVEQASSFHPATLARNAATITGNVFGGGYGLADATTFTCEKAMVGVNNEGADPTKRNGGTSVVIENGSVEGSVYGGGRLARVERNTMVTIGSESGIGTPIIEGDVYGAGMGVDTHGYSGLVRGNATVTIQDDAKVRGNVYGGGEKASLGRFFVASTDALAEAHGVEKGMPYDLKSGGTSTVIIRGSAEIGPESGNASDDSGNVFGAGKGANPADISTPGRYYLDDNNVPQWESYAGDAKKMAFHKYVLTLGITNKGNVIIDGSSTVKGSVYGGGSLGNVLSNTEVNVSAVKQTSGTTVTYVATSNQVNPTINGNVYGGGKGLGDSFTCEKAMIGKDGAGVDANYEPTDYSDGNTTIVIGNGTVNGSVYGGGEVGRVEMNTSVTVGLNSVAEGGTSAPEIMQNVFGGGKGLETHGYSALVRGNPTVIVQAGAKVRGNVYGGGQIASVARYRVAASDSEGAPYGVKKGMPYALANNNSGSCTVTVRGNAVIGPATIDENAKTTTVGHVFGAGKGIVPGGDYAFVSGTTKRMVALRDQQGVVTDNFYWEPFGSEADYLTFIKTLALASQTNVTIDGSATIKGSVFGGSESGFVQFDTNVNVTGGTIGVEGHGGADFGNVYGGGKGDAQYNGENNDYVEAGLVKGNTVINISEAASNKPTTIYHNIYGGGAYGTVGEFAYDATTGLPTGRKTYTVNNVVHSTTGGKATIYISGGTIGSTGQDNGMVFGSSRGDVGAPNSIHDKLAWVYDTSVTIGDTTLTTPVTTAPLIRGSVYGGGENGHVCRYSWVRVNGGTIGIESGSDVTVENSDNTTTTYKAYNYPYRGNVYGGGCGTDKYYLNPSSVTNPHDGNGQLYNPLAGIVKGEARVTIDGGHVVHNVYGAGAMGSVGTITNFDDLDKEVNGSYLYKHKTPTSDGKESYYDFGLSWPYEFTYSGTGQTTVTILDNAEIGVENNDAEGGHVFGAARGAVEVGESDISNQRYVEAKLANVRTTQVTIGTSGGKGDKPTIRGSVYGGGEDGHVYEDANVTIHHGEIAHSVFGGGKGKSTFKAAELWIGDPNNINNHTTLANQDVHSWTAGRVYGNTTVTMNDGSVGYFIYGGGNLASVGKGNYSGGSDDYSEAGYGELPPKNGGANGPLWTNTDFTGSGEAKVNIYGGTLGIDGYDSNNDNLPFGSVFGGCRGKAAMNVGARSPRYRYVPDFFLGYVNKAIVNIGDPEKINTQTYTGPTIKGSVYGGGQDGHVRNSTTVNINKGQITGQTETEGQNDETAGRSGNVFGAGSGIGTYTENGVAKISNSSGSVTCTTEVTVNDGTISGFVYGGGAMASVGPPKTPVQSDYEDKEATGTKKSLSYTKVTLNGGTIGGDVYGASRGPGDAFYRQQFTNNNITYAPDDYATVIWSEVKMSNNSTAVVNGSVYGGGEGGRVKKNTLVDLLGGTIKGDAYGGGKGTVTASNIAANVGGDVNVNLGSSVSGTSATAFWITYETDDTNKSVVKSGRVFGCNNLNGSPQGNVTVEVYKTVNGYDANGVAIPKTDEEKINSTVETDHTYELAAVYGGGNLAAYAPDNVTNQKAHVIIHGCADTSILTVYGGGNAAPVPETQVDVYSCYEIGSLFGGGNGRDRYKNSSGSWTPNPGANVGNSDHTNGTGNATTLIYGGTVHEAYGGSNKKGTIYGNVTITTSKDLPSGEAACALNVAKIVAAGKNADVEGDLIVIMDCSPADKIPELYAGADDANVNGNVELTITSGNYGKVFGGNNAGGVIRGHIILNIEETGNCETPITIDELYLGGNKAAYSQYGYYNTNTNPNDDPVWAPISKEMIAAGANHQDPVVGRIDEREDADDPNLYAAPQLNIISCTYIGKVFGGGLGTTATIYGDPVVNINMIPGSHAAGVHTFMTTDPRLTGFGLESAENPYSLGVIGNVYGGGNEADVEGDPTVNIGTKSKVKYHLSYDETARTGNTEETDGYTRSEAQNVLGAYIVGDVFGGGKGSADTFTCEKAMVGKNGDGIANPEGGTTVNIYKGLVKGNVYGGGEVGRVEKDTNVKIGNGIGTPTGTREPVIMGNVFGGGKGEKTHGYSALVRGNPTVTIEGNAKVLKSVYGGGEIASVARYDLSSGVPVALAQTNGHNSGYCTVTVKGYAEIGPDGMRMYHSEITDGTDKPDDFGHVFAAGKGILPTVYDYDKPSQNIQANYHIEGGYDIDDHMPKRMALYKDKKSAYWEYADPDFDPTDATDLDNQNVWEYYTNETDYFAFIETLALATQTNLTIGGNAFVKGSVYGGSENGTVQYDTNVTIQDHCQIGQGQEITTRYEEYTGGNLFELTTPPLKSGSSSEYYNLECASWEYDESSGAPYDPYAKYLNPEDGRYYYDDETYENYAEGGSVIAKDGHTYYGNVFGGGSGSVPYFDTEKGISRYIMTAGQVKGNAIVNIIGGHILTNVYGGCESTNVKGDAHVTMSGGTIGVPRTLAQIAAHPVTCYLFGAGKGDQRVFFNKDTNVEDVVVEITDGKIFGSVFGGGEDGHVLRDITMTIGSQTTTGEGAQATTTISGPTIGTWGTSYVDGNVFGGGRGFGGDAYTAGNVAGSVEMEIKGGSILGSVYGGGRLGSVGYGLFDAETDGAPTPGYGVMQDDNDVEEGFSSGFFTNGRGHIDITISGGTIGNTHEYIAPKANNIPTGLPADFTKWTSANWETWKNHNNIPKTEFDTSTGQLTHTKGGNVFAGGMGRFYKLDGSTYISSVDWWKLGCVKSTKLTITGGTIKSNVYGGGELGQVVGNHKVKDAQGNIVYTDANNTTAKVTGTEIIIQGSSTIGTEVTKTITETQSDGNGGTTQVTTSVPYNFGSVFGSGYGSTIESITVSRGNTTVTSKPSEIAGIVDEDTNVDMQGGEVKANIYGGGELASVKQNTYVSMAGGTVKGNVFGGGKGKADNFTCNKAMVGIVDLGVTGTGTEGDPFVLQPGGTTVNITGGTVNGNVYGGGEIARVERNTVVTIGDAAGAGTPIVQGSVFAAGAGIETHGYSALVRGTSSVTVQGKAQVKKNVYGGGEKASVGRYWVALTPELTDENGVRQGMPYGLKAGGKGTVIIQGDAVIGTDGDNNTGHVYGAGQGVTPHYYIGVDSYATDAEKPKRMTITNGISDWEYFNSRTEYLQFIETLGISAETDVTIDGDATVKGSVFGGSENGFVYHDTDVKIQGGTVKGDAFGGGRGLESFAEAGCVRWNTNLAISDGAVEGNIYGGGNLGDVGTIDKTDEKDGELTYNYVWKTTDSNGNNMDADPDHINTLGNNTVTGTNKNTGICTVDISGGTIGLASTNEPSKHGNVFGAGRGSWNTWWCEKAIAYATDVSVSGTTVVYGNVYGGGEVGRVEDDAKVTIGTPAETGTNKPNITGSVFGGGAGLQTHGYSALVRGNSEVTVQGAAKVGVNVYGGGEIASVGRFKVVDGLPTKPKGGGTCIVTVKDNAVIGTDGVDGTGDVYGSCKGVTPNYVASGDNRSKSMQLLTYAPSDGNLWSHFENNVNSPFIWRYYATEDDYLAFLPTLGLASNTHVTIGGNTIVNGSVYGGGQRGLTLGGVDVNITGGTVKKDVYGGGALANSNSSHWHEGQRTDYVELTELLDGSPVTGYYTAESANALITDVNAKADEKATYYAIFKTNVNLKSGTINGNVYGGGLGQLAKAAVNYTEEEATAYNNTHNLTVSDADYKTTSSVRVAAQSEVKAKVYGDVSVVLNKPTTSGQTTTFGDCEVKGTIFGCNNLNGSPQAGVDVHVYRTVTKTNGTVNEKPAKTNTNYEVQAVYGGGNLAAYYPDDAAIRETAKTYVTIDGCELTSIGSVYGGGNAASVPATEVVVNGTYEIGEVFGGGNGLDAITIDGVTYPNPGANVGYGDYSATEDKPNVTDEELDAAKAAVVYGIGKAHATIYGGIVHKVYGGSNTRGNVRVESRTTLENRGCNYTVDDAYGGGNNAKQDGDAVLEVGCISGLEIAYGGASNADVNGDVKLNLTNGTYGRVFGGNNLGGAIRGSIIVNIEETGCNPIVIGELYCGGNKAAYSVYGYDDNGNVKTSGDNPVPDPILNVKSFTSIGKIFGGGYGEEAVMVGDPTVNINVVKGKYSDEKVIAEGARVIGSELKNTDDDGYDATAGFAIPSHKAGAIGAIGSVFGGGNAAEVIGTPHVNIGTKMGEVMPLVSISIEDSEGKDPLEKDWTPSYQLVTVEGVDIRDNVYGAGNNAPVTGDTEVVIGKNNDVKTYSFTSYNAQNDGTAWSSGLAQTTGKYVTLSGNSKLAEVEILTNGKYGEEYVGKKFYVNPEGSGRLQLYDANKQATSIWVSIEPFEYKTYTFTSYGAASGGTEYSTGTAAPTGNFKTFNGTEYMQIVVLTNPGELSWEGRTFYVPVNAKTDGTERTQLRKATGDPEAVWVLITE